MQALKLSELMGALSHALDITEGQPEGHCVRCCWVGMHIGQHLGCSSNASRICELYLTDDLSFKRDFKWVDGSLPQVLRFVLRNTGPAAGLVDRMRAMSSILTNGDKIAQELTKTRCTRGADIARQLRFSESVALGIHSLDEHWNGQGRPEGLSGAGIPLFSRIALLSQVVDIMHSSGGREAAVAEIKERRSTWFDPQLVDAFLEVTADPVFWATLASPEVEACVFAMEPGGREALLDEDYLDDIAEAFGKVVDAKSPYTAGHSARVGLYTALLGEAMEVPEERRRWLKRGALLHDVGKLGVSNTILDKPGKLNEDEWAAMRRHPVYTEAILGRIKAFDELARVSAAHHE